VSGLDLRELIARLVGADAQFIVIGGLAVIAWGHIRTTRDLHIVPEPSPTNLNRLAGVLRELDGKVETPDGRLGPGAIATFLAAGDRALVTTALGPVDVLQGLPQYPATPNSTATPSPSTSETCASAFAHCKRCWR
jgi:hypothetical protein